MLSLSPTYKKNCPCTFRNTGKMNYTNQSFFCILFRTVRTANISTKVMGRTT